jgi:hypothetical protein
MVPSPHISKSVDTENDRRQVEKLMHTDSVFHKYKNKRQAI